MKTRIKSLITAFLLAYASIAHGQITLEHQYTNAKELYSITLADGSIKYMEDSYNPHDTPLYTLWLYNLNHTFFKSIQLNIGQHCPTGTTAHIERPRYITDKLFDMDDDIEVFVSINCAHDITWQTIIHKVVIFNEDGTVLFSRDSVGGLGGANPLEGIRYSSILNTPNGAKMIIQSATDTRFTEVYSLPGIFPALIEIVSDNSPQMEAYPNPVKNTCTVQYNTHGVYYGTVSIRDVNGYEVASQPFTDTSGSMSIDVSGLASGIYTVSLVSNGTFIGSKKIVIAN